ncbi:Uncharacterized protein TCM_035407 [Theobroma cacao]|uniref:Uncharacterized protein n=1 Tax=Theobroma cacao TaxID=3641 RepID=A0A061FHQ7_THECC|nr:Uncharacterized protein TCM_035407 [Theobroma cacao]
MPTSTCKNVCLLYIATFIITESFISFADLYIPEDTCHVHILSMGQKAMQVFAALTKTRYLLRFFLQSCT